MASDFYLTFPSNSSMKVQPDNTLAHYITDLPQRSLSGEWECGLTEIQHPHTWYNVTEEDVWFFLNEKYIVGLTPSARLAPGFYKGPVALMDHINNGLKRMVTDKVRAKLNYCPITQKITLHMSPDTVFTIPYHSAMKPMLGFRKSAAATAAGGTREYVHPRLGGPDIGVTPSATVVLSPTQTVDGPYSFRREADNVVDMARRFDTIYIYTDVVESRIVGESMAPLLRSLPVRGTHGATVSERFTNLHYVPLLRRLRTIEMDIRDDTVRRVPFEYGRVTVTLHFRRRKTRLF